MKRRTMWGHLRKMYKHTQPLKRKNLSSITQNTLTFLLKELAGSSQKSTSNLLLPKSFKKILLLWTKKSRQNATSSVERDFYKLLNNANFGIDFRNNINNCYFELIYDEISEISYLKKLDSIFDNEKYIMIFVT